jgi:hypothetical protein
MSVGAALGIVAALVAGLLLMSVPAQSAEPVQLAAVLAPEASAASASSLSAVVPESAPRDACWDGPCRQGEKAPTQAHPLRPATPSELRTGLLAHAPSTAMRVGKIGDKHLGLRLLESFYAVVGMPNRFIDPTTRSPGATERIDVGLRFVRKF